MSKEDVSFIGFCVGLVSVLVLLAVFIFVTEERYVREHVAKCAEKNAVPVISAGEWRCVVEAK